MPEPLRAALIGYGLAGRVFHGPLLRAAGFDVTAIVTRNAERRADAARAFPQARLFDSTDDVWVRRAEFDLAVVATLPGMHAPLAMAAVEAGMPVVVEKPFALDAAEARRMIDHATSRGVMVIPFHNRRWDSDQLTLRRLIDDGDLGDILRYESRFERWRPEPDPGKWREALPPSDGGGLRLDLGTHLVDQALTLFGPVDHVYSEVLSRRGGADDDVFIALRHRSGVVSHLWAGAMAAAPGPRLRVLGSRAAFVVDRLDAQEDQLASGLLPGQEGFGVEEHHRWGRLHRGDAGEPVPSEKGRWVAFYDTVARSLRDGEPPPVSAEDAVATLEILDEVRRVADRRTS